MNIFEITIQRKSGSHWPIVVEHSRPGELLSSRSEGILLLKPEDFQKLTSLLGQPQEYGIFLGKALFQEEIRDAFVSALRHSQETVRVLLFIEAEDSELRNLRWERLCSNIDDGWHLLTLEQRTPFSLYIPAITDRRFPPIGRRDLRALILVASPREIERFSLEAFNVKAAVDSVRQSLGEIPSDVLATVEGAIGLPTLDELCKHLTDRTKQYTILHFVSHGKVIDRGETVLYWAKADNKVDPVTGTRLIERLRSLRGAKGLPHFTFLSTCESASPEAEAALGGLGQRLVRDLGMPAVIAMTEKVTVKTALALALNFYRQLRQSGEVDSALHEAVASLAERGDVTVPALFSRLGGRPLFSDQLDRELTNAEIQYGLEQFKKLLSQRAPALRQRLEEQAQKLGNSLGADITALSKQARQEREQILEEVNTLCEEIVDLSFNALALGQQPPIYDARCPFLGLYPFREENHEFFFGREQLIAQLQQKLREHNFLAVLGASGSGKSSLVLAGLIPKLIEFQPALAIAYMTPSAQPSEQLQASLAMVQNQSFILVIIFIRLTRLDETALQGEKRRDTRRRVWLDELVPVGGELLVTKELVKRLAGEGARLVVTSVDSATNREAVEVAHEALIRYWPRLLNWLDENRTNLQMRETIRQAALEWQKQQQDENYLVHRGGRLEDARALSKQTSFLNQLEADYVNSCVQLRQRQEKEKEARRRREIRTAWGVATVAVVALIVTAALGAMAWQQKRQAEITKAEARLSLFLVTV